ncbi:dienelactone hydrolase [Xylariaceae sp. FL1651]|nr:dienelactone hydrolase [Xylariaceae sp. FL1651]
MASNPPGQCCTVGVKHDGTPTGTDVKIGKYAGYLATPDPAKAHKDVAILYVPDVFGIWQNSQLMADQYAANGYLTLIIDVLNGDPTPVNRPEGFDIFAWLAKGSTGDNPHTKEYVDPIVVEAIKWLQTEKGVKKLGAVGYCFGAKYVARHFEDGIKVGFMAHPSFVEEDELRGFKAPLSIAAAETDTIFPAEKRHRSEEILKEGGQPYQINLYSGVQHGFAVRSDISKKDQRFAKEQAFYQAIQWFDNFLL